MSNRSRSARSAKGTVAVAKPLFGKAKLTIGGRDRTKLVEGLAKQVNLVEAVMTERAPGVPARGALCFADAASPRARRRPRAPLPGCVGR